jgi:hypothetical protein
MIKHHIFIILHNELTQIYSVRPLGKLQNYNYSYWMTSTQRQSMQVLSFPPFYTA